MYWKPYVPAAKRRAAASRHATTSKARGVPLSPVVIAGRTIARSFWGNAWCEAMESYGDYANRLPRGRTYVRNGSVVDLRVEPGWIRAMVSGSSLYETTVKVAPLAPARWAAVVDEHAGQVSSLVDLLQGRLPDSLLQSFCTRSSGLFPGPKDLEFSCSCPDWATMCKHVAAVLYGVGARLDENPGLFFVLRGVDPSDLAVRGAAVGFSGGGGEDDLAGVDLGDLFGIDLGGATPPVAAPKAKAVPAPATKAAAAPKAPRSAAKAPKTRVVPAPATDPASKARARSAATTSKAVGAAAAPTAGRSAAAAPAPPAAPAASSAPAKRAGTTPSPVAASRKRAAPRTSAPLAMAPISAADFERYGVDRATVADWLRGGVLRPTREPGVYTPTAETGPRLRAFLAERRG